VKIIQVAMLSAKKLILNRIRSFLKEEIQGIVFNDSKISKLESQIASLQDKLNNLSNQDIYISKIDSLEKFINTVKSESDLKSLSLLSINKWYEPSIYESAVNLALRDICHLGDTVFDVGANEGGLTLLMSRLVGPKGTVCAFEANPYILDLCTHNLIRNGCNNFYINHGCVWDISGDVLDLYIPSNNWNAASVSKMQGCIATSVKTIALDDYINSTKLEPEVIKMDIEGAEFHALKGAEQYINRMHPHLILEQSTNSGSCLELLANMGYVAIDLNNYNFIKSINDYPQGSQIRNVLFIHEHKIENTPYSLEMRNELFLTFGCETFSFIDNVLLANKVIELEKGRYFLFIGFEVEDTDEVLSLNVYVNNQLKILHIANAIFLQNSYRDCILDIDCPSTVTIEMRFLEPTESSILKIGLINFHKIINISC